jgi:hypothetical protein
MSKEGSKTALSLYVNMWTTFGASLNTARYSHGMTVYTGDPPVLTFKNILTPIYAGRVFAYGGQNDGFIELSSVEMLATGGDSWSTFPSPMWWSDDSFATVSF